MKFSERMGFVEVNDVIQINKMSEALRNDIYNFCEEHYFNSTSSEDRYLTIWEEFFHKKRSDYYSGWLDGYFDNLRFYEVYDYLEFIINKWGQFDGSLANKMLEEGHSGYRFVNDKLVAISNEIDIKPIEDASNSGIDGNNINLALEELSKRQNVDYQVVVQKSINAVEMVARHISISFFDGRDKETLGDSIKNLSKHNFIINHPAYLKALGNLYGYTSDGGIRHPKETNQTLDHADAIFMLELCSAFVSMLKTKLSEWEK